MPISNQTKMIRDEVILSKDGSDVVLTDILRVEVLLQSVTQILCMVDVVVVICEMEAIEHCSTLLSDVGRSFCTSCN